MDFDVALKLDVSRNPAIDPKRWIVVSDHALHRPGSCRRRRANPRHRPVAEAVPDGAAANLHVLDRVAILPRIEHGETAALERFRPDQQEFYSITSAGPTEHSKGKRLMKPFANGYKQRPSCLASHPMLR